MLAQPVESGRWARDPGPIGDVSDHEIKLLLCVQGLLAANDGADARPGGGLGRRPLPFALAESLWCVDVCSCSYDVAAASFWNRTQRCRRQSASRPSPHRRRGPRPDEQASFSGRTPVGDATGPGSAYRGQRRRLTTRGRRRPYPTREPRGRLVAVSSRPVLATGDNGVAGHAIGPRGRDGSTRSRLLGPRRATPSPMAER